MLYIWTYGVYYMVWHKIGRKGRRPPGEMVFQVTGRGTPFLVCVPGCGTNTLYLICLVIKPGAG